MTVLILDKSGFLFLKRDGECDEILTTCFTMLPACLATDRQILTALTVVMLDDETDDLRESDEVDAAGVDVVDLAYSLVDIADFWP